ncbi:hypothetical protein CJ030_MR8G023482 [Morella rubra]|uniref:Uncharacterized protein n=1 Tax=Morella rubra TaxID=262757 RepID=A0A6A1URQ9_9ROSI|nr:hypothetical protein CJ030_MR8G023482 [Morella rubra]
MEDLWSCLCEVAWWRCKMVKARGGRWSRNAEESGSLRRELFDGGFEIKKQGNEVPEEEEARVSICIPPKNALLLMRCRSDPVKMTALTNKFWGPPVQKEEGINETTFEDEGQTDEEEEEEKRNVEVGEGREGKVSCRKVMDFLTILCPAIQIIVRGGKGKYHRPFCPLSGVGESWGSSGMKVKFGDKGRGGKGA